MRLQCKALFTGVLFCKLTQISFYPERGSGGAENNIVAFQENFA